MKSLLSLALLLGAVLAAPAGLAQETTAYDDAPQDLLATLEAQGNFTVLVSALRDTGLDAALASDETYTVFAPTDEAFQSLPAGTLDSLSPEQLTEILRYHILVGAVPSDAAATLVGAPTVQGSEVAISTADGQLRVGEATVIEADLEASNGVIHVIDTVLMPKAEMDHDSMEDGMMEEKMGDDSAMEMEDDGAPAPQN